MRRSAGGGRASSRKAAPTTESAKLEEEAARMEQKLRALRAQMSAEKEQWAARKTSAGGGSRWRSGRADRGSIRGFAKDVKSGAVRAKRGTGSKPGAAGASGPARGSPGARARGEGPRRGGGSGARPMSARRAAALRWEEAATWSVSQVLRWLDELGLGTYASAFETNAISGAVLLELTAEDLDYMNVSVLGHRKVCLKGVEQLRAAVYGAAATADGTAGVRDGDPHKAAAPPTPPRGMATQASSTDAAAVGEAKEKEAPRVVHWSAAPPLSSNEVSGTGTDTPVNLADGVFDEAAQHRAFQQAVMEWRNGGASATATQSSTSAGATLAAAGGEGDGMWHNPFAPSGGDEPKEAGAGERGKLLGGELDEAAEHEAFQRAVEAWRRGEAPAAASASESKQGESTGAMAGGDDKTSCYNCYKLFYREAGRRTGVVVDEHEFCTAKCASSWEEARARAKAAAEANAKAAEELEALRKEADEAGDKPPSSARLVDADGDEHPDPHDNSPRRDYGSIWDLEVEY